MKPTSRTLQALRDRGLIPGMVERYNSFSGKRSDLFGIVDIIALDHENGVVGVQSTGTAFSEHKKKLMGEREQECIDWLKTPGTSLELYGWRKVKMKRGGKRMIYKSRIAHITLVDGVLTFTESKDE